MADDGKKYFWLKLQRGFFKRHDMQIIEDMQNGKDYVLFYLKLLVESVDHDGRLRFSDTIPYDETMLATITRTNIDIVRSAVRLLAQLKLVEILDDGTYFLNQVESMTGSVTEWAEKKRIYRLQQELEAKGQKEDMSDKSKTKIKSQSKTQNEDISQTGKHRHGEFKHVLLTDGELTKLKDDFPLDWEQRIKRLDEYIENKGAKYKNHNLTIRNWANRDRERSSANGRDATFKAADFNADRPPFQEGKL